MSSRSMLIVAGGAAVVAGGYAWWKWVERKQLEKALKEQQAQPKPKKKKGGIRGFLRELDPTSSQSAFGGVVKKAAYTNPWTAAVMTTVESFSG